MHDDLDDELHSIDGNVNCGQSQLALRLQRKAKVLGSIERVERTNGDDGIDQVAEDPNVMEILEVEEDKTPFNTRVTYPDCGRQCRKVIIAIVMYCRM